MRLLLALVRMGFQAVSEGWPERGSHGPSPPRQSPLGSGREEWAKGDGRAALVGGWGPLTSVAQVPRCPGGVWARKDSPVGHAHLPARQPHSESLSQLHRSRVTAEQLKLERSPVTEEPALYSLCEPGALKSCRSLLCVLHPVVSLVAAGGAAGAPP